MVSLNCYQEGYDNGFRDAMNGKAMSFSGFPKGKAFLSDNAYDSYVDGYKQGYRDGMAKKNDVYR